jgi:hypothetical protein
LLVALAALALLLAAPAGAQRCRVTDSTFTALSADGRFGLVATRGPFSVELELRDFERGVPVLATELDGNGSVALDSDELLALGEQQLEAVERQVYGTLAEVKQRLAPTCAGDAFEHGLSGASAAAIDVRKDRFAYAVSRPPYVVLVFEHRDEDASCDEDRGDRVLGFHCGDAPKGSPDDGARLTSAKPGELRPTLAAVGARPGSALTVLGLLAQLAPARRAALPRDVRLGLVVEELSAFRRLGFLGRSACRQRALATYAREAPKPGENVPPSERALFREIERQRRLCLTPSVAP